MGSDVGQIFPTASLQRDHSISYALVCEKEFSRTPDQDFCGFYMCEINPSHIPVPALGKDKLEDLKVLRRSPDLLNNAKIGQGQLQLILFYHICRLQPLWSSDLNNLMNNPSSSPVISEKKMLRYVCGIPNDWPWIKGHRSAWHLVLNIKPLSQ